MRQIRTEICSRWTGPQLAWLAVALIAAGLLVAGCSNLAGVGKEIDKICIKGKLTAEEAATLKRLGADENDRVLAKECSELLREITGRNE